MGDVERGKVFNEHNNDSGDWCAWSMCSVTDDVPDDAQCPAGCRASAVEDAE
jgi:hypothetical protein